MHVLYVDPDPAARDAVEAAFGEEGFVITLAEDPVSVLEILESTGVDALICEYGSNAPDYVYGPDAPDYVYGSDGADVATLIERARELAPDLPVVIYADGVSEATMAELVAAGIDGYVPKSRGTSALIDQLAKIEASVGRERESSNSHPVQNVAGSDGRSPGIIGRTGQLEALQWASRRLMQAGSRREIAEEVIDAVESVLDEPIASVRLYDPDERTLEPTAFTGPARDRFDSQGLDPPPISPGNGPLWEAFESGQGSVFDAAEFRNAGIDDALLDAFPEATAVVEPLDEHGILAFGATGEDFDEADLNVARIIGATAAAAMDGAERARELARYRTIVEAAGDAVFALDADGQYVEVNDRFLELVGYDREEILGAHASLLLDERDLERAREHIKTLLDGDDRSITYEVTFETADGRAVPVEVSQSLMPAEGFAGTIATARVIAERKRMERTLREHKSKIESLHEVATSLDKCTSETEICELTVEAVEDILAFDACIVALVEEEEFVVQEMSFEEPPDVFERRGPTDVGIIGRTFTEGETFVIDDVRALDDARETDDSYRALLSTPIGDRGVVQAISTEVGSFTHEDAELVELLAAHVANALNRVAFQAQLRAERDRMAALFDNVPDPVVRIHHTEEGPIIRGVNGAFEEVFGFDAVEIRGENLDECIVPDRADETARALNERAVGGDIVETEVRRRTTDGLRDFELTVVPVDLDEGNRSTFSIYTDVTERKHRRRRVQVLNRVLRHDLRNGMNIVKGAAEQLLDHSEKELTAEYAGMIVDRADELLALVERTRATERALDREGGSERPLDLVDLVERSVETLSTEYPAADLDVSLPSRAVVVGNSLLELAVIDLIENAIVHNDRPTPGVSVSLTAADLGDAYVLRVEDDGPGIPEDERQLLAEDREITQLRHASGIGLWLIKWAVTHAGGDLEIETVDPRGTIFTIYLPRADERTRVPGAEH